MATGNILAYLTPPANEPPSSSYALASTLVAATGVRPVLKFSDASDLAAVFTFTMPDAYDGTSSLVVEVGGCIDGANTGTKAVRIGVSVERIQSTDSLAAGGNDFAAEQTSNVTVNNTANAYFEGSVTLTNAQADGVQSGDLCRVRVRRIGSNGADDATGNFLMVGGHVRQA
jgi:prepilin-type processing-associated H-X9-DG protein